MVLVLEGKDTIVLVQFCRFYGVEGKGIIQVLGGMQAG